MELLHQIANNVSGCQVEVGSILLNALAIVILGILLRGHYSLQKEVGKLDAKVERLEKCLNNKRREK